MKYIISIFIVLLGVVVLNSNLEQKYSIHYKATPQPEAFWAEVTGYSSSVQETDDTPFITASGERVKDGGIACPNWLEFGDIVEIEGKEYECNDVMNKRYRDGKYFDIWYPTRVKALKAGRQQLSVKVLSE